MGAKLAGAWGTPPPRMLLLLLPRAVGGRLPPGWGMMPRALTALSLGHSCGDNTQPGGKCDLPTLAGVLLAPWQLASSLWPSQLIPAALCPHATSWGQAGHNSFRD